MPASPPTPPGSERASRLRIILFGVFALVDLGAIYALCWGIYDGFRYDGGAGNALLVALLIAAGGFTAGAFLARRRGRHGLALGLAAAPAVPAILATAATLFFIATFHHQP